MIVEIVDGRPVGYLTIFEYAARNYVTANNIRYHIQNRKLEVLKIGSDKWIREDAPYPEDARLKENRIRRNDREYY